MLRRLSADDGAGGGGATTNNQPNTLDGAANNTGAGDGQQVTPPAANNPGGQQTAATTQTTQTTTSTGITLTPEQQAHVDKLLKERLEEDRTRRKNEEQREAAKKAGEYQKLYDEEHPQFETLKEVHATTAAERDKLRDYFNRQVDAEIAEWHPLAKRSDPGKDKPLERIAWVEQVKKEYPDATQGKLTPGNPETPRGGSTQPTGTVSSYLANRYNKVGAAQGTK
jgi:hypothetical protein